MCASPAPPPFQLTLNEEELKHGSTVNPKTFLHVKVVVAERVWYVLLNSRGSEGFHMGKTVLSDRVSKA